MRDTLRVVQPEEAARSHEADTASLARAPLGTAAADVPIVLAALACGRFDRVQRLLRESPPSPALPLIAGRFAAWTGDLFTIAGIWPHVRAALAQLDTASETTTHAADAVLAATGLGAIQRTATDLGDPHLAASLLARERRARDRLRHVELDAVASLIAASAGLLPVSPAAARAASPPHDAALRVLALVTHGLGVDPDAARHRLRLRPRLPDGADRLLVHDIGCGDATIALDLHRKAARLICRVEQHSGAMPLTLILEPVLPAAPRRATVDGGPAELDARTESDDLLLPVQLVLDAPRTLDISLQDDEGPPR